MLALVGALLFGTSTGAVCSNRGVAVLVADRSHPAVKSGGEPLLGLIRRAPSDVRAGVAVVTCTLPAHHIYDQWERLPKHRSFDDIRASTVPVVWLDLCNLRAQQSGSFYLELAVCQ